MLEITPSFQEARYKYEHLHNLRTLYLDEKYDRREDVVPVLMNQGIKDVLEEARSSIGRMQFSERMSKGEMEEIVEIISEEFELKKN